MNVPVFSAEASLYKTGRHYQSGGQVINVRPHMIGAVSPAAPGQDFPNQKCACKGCASGGGDLIGQCASVCKDKTVYSKGSESYDYCKKAIMQPPKVFVWDVGDAVSYMR